MYVSSEDAQERLAFRAHVHLNEHIALFVPSPALLAYPSCLQISSSSKGPDNSNNNNPGTVDTSASGSDSGVGSATQWYPTLSNCLSCLGKVYPCLSFAVFTTLAQQAVQLCTGSLVQVISIASHTYTHTVTLSLSLSLSRSSLDMYVRVGDM